MYVCRDCYRNGKYIQVTLKDEKSISFDTIEGAVHHFCTYWVRLILVLVLACVDNMLHSPREWFYVKDRLYPIGR